MGVHVSSELTGEVVTMTWGEADSSGGGMNESDFCYILKVKSV